MAKMVIDRPELVKCLWVSGFMRNLTDCLMDADAFQEASALLVVVIRCGCFDLEKFFEIGTVDVVLCVILEGIKSMADASMNVLVELIRSAVKDQVEKPIKIVTTDSL